MIKFCNYNIILPKHFEIVKKEGKPAEKIAVGSEGEAEGGVWGEFRLARAEAKPRRPALKEQRVAKKFSLPFRRKKKLRSKIKK